MAGFLLATLLCVAPPVPAFACMPASDPTTARLFRLIDDDPVMGLSAADRELAGLTDPVIHARFHAIKAEALGILSRNDEAAAAARAGLRIAPATAPILRDTLRVIEASNSFHLDQASRDLPSLRRVLARVPARTTLHGCIAATIGDLERRSGDLVGAAHHLTDAYRETRNGPDRRLAAEAAHLLFKLVFDTGDYDTALALNRSSLDYYRPRHARAKLVLLTVFRARVLNRQGDYATALRLANSAEDAMRGRGDRIGDGYRALETCRALVGLAQWGEATLACGRARTGFGTSASTATAQTDILRARIALARYRPGTALALLNPVIAGPSARSSSVDISDAYLLRAEAHHRLGHDAASYADLQQQIDRYRAWSEAARGRQTVVAGVWLARDQQVIRASVAEAKLARELTAAARSAGQVRLTVIVGIAAIAIAVILLVFGARHRRRLARMALTDPLTGLPNRRAIASSAGSALADAARRNEPISFAVLDLDHFKKINDTLGHAGGDAVLIALARAAGETLPAPALFGRWGGEEFLAIFPATPAIDAAMTLEHLRERVRDAAVAGAQIRFSAGVAEWRGGDPPIGHDALIARADAAAYRAKAMGRDRTCIDGDDVVLRSCPTPGGRGLIASRGTPEEAVGPVFAAGLRPSGATA